jgi:hypothetical protein
MHKLTLFIQDGENIFNAVATVEAHGITLGRAVWNTNTPDQHGTGALWALDDLRRVIVSPLHILRIDAEHYALTAVSLSEGLVYLKPLAPQEKPSEKPLFALGEIVITPAARDAFAASEQTPQTFLRRHVRGDWGEIICQDDAAANHASVRNGTRILSAYLTSAGVKFWIITEADRSSTTLLLPEEY